jgi:hypothetical protein
MKLALLLLSAWPTTLQSFGTCINKPTTTTFIQPHRMLAQSSEKLYSSYLQSNIWIG